MVRDPSPLAIVDYRRWIVTEVKQCFQYLNHIIGFWARLCPSLLTFHGGPVKSRPLSEPHKILLVIYIPA